jgi:hypothetical protein
MPSMQNSGSGEMESESESEMRTIIQITSVPNGLVALCDDGTLWGCLSVDGKWTELPGVPQPPEEPPLDIDFEGEDEPSDIPF